MRKFFVLGALGAVLAGCSSVYDQDAFPAADAMEGVAMAQCNARVADKTFSTVSQYVECELAAERATMVAVKFQKPELFEAYVVRMRLAAAQADARTITPEQTSAQITQARGDFRSQTLAAVDNQRRKAQAWAAGLAAASESMQRQADRDAYIQAHTPSINCTSTTFAGTVNTHCN